ncbi:hypothetical protein SEA_YDN12_25 [Streptomyces phage YDN12]|uniref:Uncharacterized protein n=1 Tax=Streptomyces phage YDN12 TaxID=1636183 RepID=A0A0E3JTH3_9CAUD|nr:hypothetical protein AVT63_gp24 [Streptomyces phage YDN12]AKA61692.1 hypothetical protein SEA_YDN12_25 [Streptomyces phage YDN12]
MAQRNTPARRIPGEPLAGILRTVAYQARYSNRRRADVPSITNAAASAESAEAAAGADTFATLDAPATLAEAMAQVEADRFEASQQSEAAATRVAAVPELPRDDAATLQVDENGRATWQYEDRGTVPHVVVTAATNQPAVATVSVRTHTSTTVHVWDLAGLPVPGCFVMVLARWP